MEENLNGEQPSNDLPVTQETNLEEEKDLQSQNVEKAVENDKPIDGSLGKFKDTESLLNAYNNLQAEFTKKCQSFSELKSKIDNDAEKKATPIYEREDWTEKVGAFLDKNKEAQPYISEIAKTIMQDGELASNDSALDLAYAKVASTHLISPEKAAEDDSFVNNYALKSEKIKNAVLGLYLKELEKQKTPTVLKNDAGSSQVLYKNPTANSLSEAKDIVKKMFE